MVFGTKSRWISSLKDTECEHQYCCLQNFAINTSGTYIMKKTIYEQMSDSYRETNEYLIIYHSPNMARNLLAFGVSDTQGI